MIKELFERELDYRPTEAFYHGTSTNAGITDRILPPDETNTISEIGRKKNLNKVFFTKDIGLAKIYAGRTTRVLGGKPIVYKIIPMGKIKVLDDRKGASVYYSNWAFVDYTVK